MKKKKVKLTLKKQTISKLNEQELNEVMGGGSFAFCGSSAHHFTCGCTNNSCAPTNPYTYCVTECLDSGGTCYATCGGGGGGGDTGGTIVPIAR
ncbi:MAG: class I lanthipeptide [Bacteroidota bacterium]